MKKQFSGFISGFLCAVVLFGIVVSCGALITEPTNIQVSPIGVIVNGEVFQPKDANGQPVDVFAYNGTTYAPLRALAEAYGLEVGYDRDKNLATVTQKHVGSNVTTGSNSILYPIARNRDYDEIEYTVSDYSVFVNGSKLIADEIMEDKQTAKEIPVCIEYNGEVYVSRFYVKEVAVLNLTDWRSLSSFLNENKDIERITITTEDANIFDYFAPEVLHEIYKSLRYERDDRSKTIQFFTD